MTVPSAIGIIGSYFVAQDQSRALSVFAAAGGIGFCTGLVFGGFLTSSLGWRYIFRLSVILMGTLGVVGFLILPRDRLEGQARPRLDILGAGLSTVGLFCCRLSCPVAVSMAGISPSSSLCLLPPWSSSWCSLTSRRRSATRLCRSRCGRFRISLDFKLLGLVRDPHLCPSSLLCLLLNDQYDSRIRRIPDGNLLSSPHRPGSEQVLRRRNRSPIPSNGDSRFRSLPSHG